ncbi:hypothetical protein KFK09_003465 [Dendrobium nobile]|uniref:DUF4005 domain-containing protein n=1 Tax=Dendrobium nobile TaxID=94219 RepID=A0A8T3C382_DENNO|nr:hypothetical protein KFK09_003465 [Dendrobium nobile]
MGRATKWLRRLFGSKRETGEPKVPCNEERKEKKRWSFKSGRDSFDTAGRIPPAEAAWLRPLYGETEEEQSKHAIAVAAATAAVADAAVAAAQAAVAVVRLTSNGGGVVFRGVNERLAAIKIQTYFRGYLARRALRALKALVKLQALVRGYLIRKKAAATLHSMEALIRVQHTVRAQKSKSLIFHRSLERIDEIRTEKASSFHSSSLDWSPKIFKTSPLPRQLQRRPLTPDWNLHLDQCRCSFTAQSTPRFMNSVNGFLPPSPSTDHPHYMSKTQAFEAKVRSQSAPKQRTEPSRKRVPLGELMVDQEQARASLSSHGIQRSCSQGKESLNFKNAVAGRLELNRETERGFYFQRK